MALQEGKGYVLSSRITNKHDVWGTNAKRILPSDGKSLIHSHWPLATLARPRSITDRSRVTVHKTSHQYQNPHGNGISLWSVKLAPSPPHSVQMSHVHTPPRRHLTREATIYGHSLEDEGGPKRNAPTIQGDHGGRGPGFC